jgi:hypothetical protein
MALNAGIFGNMLAAPRSAMDYQNEYAAQDDAKVLRQANLLALQDKRQAAADAALQRQQAQDVRNKLTGLPATATPEDVARVYQGAGMVDHAEKVLKSWTDRQKELAGIDKTKGETLDGALTRHRAMLEQAQNPQDAARMLAAQYSDPILGPVMAKTHGPLEAAVQAIPQTPAEFDQWRGANTMGMTKYQEHVAQKPTAVDLGDRKVMVDMNPNSPTYLKQVAENKVGMSPAEASAANNRPLIADPSRPGQFIANAPFQQFEKDKAKAGAAVTNVNMNDGQKGFDNEVKLRKDFQSEPIYKAHQEMQSAYGQIGQALKQASPSGDLAAATKIMKLLDPGSVVRESELGMAMAATGMMDRITSYAGNVLNGTKLTTQQRKDFQQLADALMTTSVDQFNVKHGEYMKLGSDYGLNASRALGAPAKPVGPAAKPSGKPAATMGDGTAVPDDIQALLNKHGRK